MKKDIVFDRMVKTSIEVLNIFKELVMELKSQNIPVKEQEKVLEKFKNVVELGERMSKVESKDISIPKVYYTLKETAKALGVDYHTILTQANAGKIPYKQVGKKMLVPAKYIEKLSITFEDAEKKY